MNFIMVKVLVLFGPPLDKESFDSYFKHTHLPLIAKLPNLQASRTNFVAGAVTGENTYHLIVELEFSSEEEMQNGLNSESGQIMARDFSNFASGGVTVLPCQTQEV